MNLIPRELRLLLAVKRFQHEVTMNGTKSWLPSLITLALTALSLFEPQAQSYVVAHPQVAVGLAGLYAVLKGLLPSPVAGAAK